MYFAFRNLKVHISHKNKKDAKNKTGKNWNEDHVTQNIYYAGNFKIGVTLQVGNYNGTTHLNSLRSREQSVLSKLFLEAA